jgi:hypothetical protein
MGVDIYAGPLCRYYAEDWELITISALREVGIQVNVMRPGPIFPASSDREEIYKAVSNWKYGVLSQLSKAGLEAQAWPEAFDLPYMTDKPDGDGIDALRIFAAYSALGVTPFPTEVPQNVDDNPIVRRFFDYEGENLLTNIELLIEYQAWVPVVFRGVLVRPEMPNGARYFIGSVDVLHEALEQINARTWRAGPTEIERWRHRGPLGKSAISLETPLLKTGPSVSADGLSYVEHMAQFGFATMFSLAEWAKSKRMPMIVDA